MALLPSGGQAQYVTVPEGLLMPIPAGLTLPQAAAIPETWLTAFQLLHLIGEEARPHAHSMQRGSIPSLLSHLKTQ